MPSITIQPATPEDRAGWLTMRGALWPAAPEEGEALSMGGSVGVA